MKTYLEGCGVPTTRVGATELPRLIMGIHPYDGCSYVSKARDAENYRLFDRAAKVVEVLRCAVEEAGLTTVQVDHMFPVLNRLHLQAVWETEQETGVAIGRVAYILIPVRLDGELVAWSDRAYATFYAHNERLGGEAFRRHIREDGIMRYLLSESPENLVTPETTPPYTPAEAERFAIDYPLLEQHLGFFAGCDILVADPGAEIDILAMTGRLDLIQEYLAFLRTRFRTIITSVHHAGVTIPILEAEGVDVDGYLTPVNRLGALMSPTRDIALDAIRQATKPIIAIKPMAGGRYLGRQAFEYVFDEVGVAATMFGLGTVEQVRETAKAAREALGIA
ncbi:MAG: hypothetical protein FJZ90_07455 [Chloroflexi bacterium]|nr:hypothetical protein [Chloroflexota bacterium]